MAHRIDHVLRAVMDEPWAMTPEALRVVVEVLERRMDGTLLTEDEIAAALAASGRAAQAAAGADSLAMQRAVAVVPIRGMLAPRMNLVTQMSGGAAVEHVRRQVRAANARPDVDTIVLDIDSPGGQVGGVPELAADLRAAETRVVAVANGLMGSAAYWIASGADEIVVTPSGEVGSIGVAMIHTDRSQQSEKTGVRITLLTAGAGKDDGNPFEPLSEAARERIQARIDARYEQFVADIVTGRQAAGKAVTAATVRDEWQADVYLTAAAVERGLADRIATLEETIDRSAGSVVDGPSTRASSAADETRVRRARRLALG